MRSSLPLGYVRWKTLRSVGQLLEHPVAVGDVPGVAVFQSPEAHLFGARVLAAVLQQRDGLALPRDAEFPAPKQGVGFLKKLLQGGSIHNAVYQPAGSIHERAWRVAGR
jgi:hypothetical protein